jgi:hypothetical protein
MYIFFKSQSKVILKKKTFKGRHFGDLHHTGKIYRTALRLLNKSGAKETF